MSDETIQVFTDHLATVKERAKGAPKDVLDGLGEVEKALTAIRPHLDPGAVTAGCEQILAAEHTPVEYRRKLQAGFVQKRMSEGQAAGKTVDAAVSVTASAMREAAEPSLPTNADLTEIRATVRDAVGDADLRDLRELQGLVDFFGFDSHEVAFLASPKGRALFRGLGDEDTWGEFRSMLVRQAAEKATDPSRRAAASALLWFEEKFSGLGQGLTALAAQTVEHAAPRGAVDGPTAEHSGPINGVVIDPNTGMRVDAQSGRLL